MQIGAMIEGISAERQLPRKTKLTSATSRMEMPMVTHTSKMAWEVNSEESTAITSLVPGGRVLLMASTSRWTASEISRSLAWLWRVRTMPIRSTPLPRKVRRASFGPSSTRAMSPRRVM